jgi:hypothetical protein
MDQCFTLAGVVITGGHSSLGKRVLVVAVWIGDARSCMAFRPLLLLRRTYMWSFKFETKQNKTGSNPHCEVVACG